MTIYDTMADLYEYLLPVPVNLTNSTSPHDTVFLLGNAASEPIDEMDENAAEDFLRKYAFPPSTDESDCINIAS